MPEQLQHRTPRISGNEDWRPLSLDEVRKVHIQKVLQMCNGNRLRAAHILKRDGFDARPHTNGAAA